MRTETIPVDRLSKELQAMVNNSAFIEAAAWGHGDGVVGNGLFNAPLCAEIVNLKQLNSGHGGGQSNSFYDLFSYLPGLEAHFAKIKQEVAGLQLDDAQLALIRQRLYGRWHVLAPDDRQQIRQILAARAERTALVVDPAKAAAHAIIARTADLRDSLGRDNPSAMLAQWLKLPELSEARQRDLTEWRAVVNRSRYATAALRLQSHSERLDAATEALMVLAEAPDDRDALYRLARRAEMPLIKPFNWPFYVLGGHFNSPGRRPPEDGQIYWLTLMRLLFERTQPVLRRLFRLHEKPAAVLDNRPSGYLDEAMDWLAVIGELGEPYDSFISQLREDGLETQAAFEARDYKTAKAASRRVWYAVRYRMQPGQEIPGDWFNYGYIWRSVGYKI